MPIAQLPTPATTLVLVDEMPHCAPGVLFDYWTQPDLVCTWWPAEAEIEPRPGGAFRLSWPKMNWHLWGCYSAFEPGQRLAFPWQWEHMRYSLAKEVTITFEALAPASTKMTITHGPYSNSEEDRQARQEHLDGWLHFVARLQHVL